MSKMPILCALALILTASLLAAQTPPANPPASNPPQANSPAANPADQYSGMYTFLKEGEFLQLSIEDGRVSGFVSRYGDQQSDQGAFLDQFFKEGKIEGKKLTFTTKTVHGVWFEFKGTVERGEGKNPGDEAYYALKGKLTRHAVSADNKSTSKSQEIVFKAFPQNLDIPNQP